MAAPTYTEAGAQTEMTAAITALEGGDWQAADTKLFRYGAARAFLIESGSAAGQAFAKANPSVSELSAQIDRVRVQAARLVDSGRRVVHGRTNYGR